MLTKQLFLLIFNVVYTGNWEQFPSSLSKGSTSSFPSSSSILEAPAIANRHNPCSLLRFLWITICICQNTWKDHEKDSMHHPVSPKHLVRYTQLSPSLRVLTLWKEGRTDMAKCLRNKKFYPSFKPVCFYIIDSNSQHQTFLFHHFFFFPCYLFYQEAAESQPSTQRREIPFGFQMSK